METSKAIKLKVNGKQLELHAAPNSTLLEILRNNGHVEVKCGCEKGDCGACAVILDGEAVDSCLTLAWIADGSEVQTVKGIGTEATPHPQSSGSPGLIVVAPA